MTSPLLPQEWVVEAYGMGAREALPGLPYGQWRRALAGAGTLSAGVPSSHLPGCLEVANRGAPEPFCLCLFCQQTGEI